MQRSDYLKWCKERALEYVEKGELDLAWASMVSDLNKNDETRNHLAINLGTMLMLSGRLNTKEEMKKFINDFG